MLNHVCDYIVAVCIRFHASTSHDNANENDNSPFTG
ncbi:hypothetical protein [Salmonella phage NINP13076]|nr:hypothetical protein [Salmonella phage NINP13076]